MPRVQFSWSWTKLSATENPGFHRVEEGHNSHSTVDTREGKKKMGIHCHDVETHLFDMFVYYNSHSLGIERRAFVNLKKGAPV